MTKDALTIKRELAKPFAPEDLEWRLQHVIKEKNCGLAVPYVTNRAIQDRLDDVVGPENWHNDFKPWHASGKKESQICGISIYNAERKEWNTKWDGAEDTDIEAVKGGLSDSMKRAAVQWGIGRVLYKMEVVWVSVESRGSSWTIKDSERVKLDKAYLDMLKRLKLTPAAPGGLQSELTATETIDIPQEGSGPVRGKGAETATHEKQAAKTKEAQLQDQQPAAKITQLPSAEKLKCEYKVNSVKVQNGMNRNPTTSLVLVGQDGKAVRAFYRGTDSALVPNAELADVKLTMMQQDTVVFYVLNSYQVINTVPKAA